MQNSNFGILALARSDNLSARSNCGKFMGVDGFQAHVPTLFDKCTILQKGPPITK